MSETTFTFRVDKTLKAQFAEAARSEDRAGSQLLRDFMRDFVKKKAGTEEYEAWFRRQVQAGIEDAEAGRLVSDEDVRAEFAARRAASRRRAAQRS